MKYIEIDLGIKLKEDIKYYNLSEKISQGINKYFLYNEELTTFHEENKFKFYNFSLLTPIEKDKLYKKNKTYNLTLRFFNKEILNSFYESLLKIENSIFSVVNRNFRIIEQKEKIKYLETITPCVITLKKKNINEPLRYLDVTTYDKKSVLNYLNGNSLKKYRNLIEDIDTQYNFIEDVEILNKKSIIFSYKKGIIIGNKFKLKIKDDELSQKIAFLTLGSGLSEKNSLSYGFCKEYYEDQLI